MKWTYKHFANFFGVMGIVVAAGCGATRPALMASDTNPGMAWGKWEHVQAAVEAAVGPNEFAVVDDDFSVTGKAARFELLGVHGVAGELVVSKRGDEIDVAAHVRSAKGGSAQERKLVRDVKFRLEQLRENGWAPLPKGWD